MEETNAQPTLMKHAIRWGLIVGVASIVLSLLLYAIDYRLMVLLKTLLISLLIYLGLTIYSGIDYRKSIGGFIPFGKAFQHAFLVLAISALVATVYNFVLYNVIDPELPKKLTEASIDNAREMMQNFGAPEDKIEEELAKTEERTAGQFTVTGQLMGYGFILIFSAIMALISGAIVKKNEPVEF